MKKLTSFLFLILLSTGAVAQGNFSSATMEVEVKVISGTTIESVQPLQILVKDEELEQKKVGLLAVHALEGVDFEVQLTESPELKNEYGESLRVRLYSEKEFDAREKRNKVYIRPASSDVSSEFTRGSYTGSVNTSIYYM